MSITFDDVKKVNDLRKSGNSAEGIVFARNAIKSNGPDNKMAFALSWCLYDEYIKPLYFHQNSKNQPNEVLDTIRISVEEESVRSTAESALKEIALLTNESTATGTLSPYLLGSLKYLESLYKFLKYGRQDPTAFNYSIVLLMGIDSSKLTDRNPSFPGMPSTKERFTRLILDFSGLDENLTGDMKTQKKLITLLKTIPADALTTDKIEFRQSQNNGLSRKSSSPVLSFRQRYVMRLAKLSLEVKDLDEVERVCRKALVEDLFKDDPNAKWIKYWLAKALENSKPEESLELVDELLRTDQDGYILALRATILKYLDRKQEALVSVAHSLMMSTTKSRGKNLVTRPEMLSKSLQMFIDLSEDEDEICKHVQAVRGLRLKKQLSPLNRLEELATNFNLGPAMPSDDLSSLIPIWSGYSNYQVRGRSKTIEKNQFLGQVVVVYKISDDQIRVLATANAAEDTLATEHRAVIVGLMKNVLYVQLLGVQTNDSDVVIEDPVSAGLDAYVVDMPKISVSPKTYVMNREVEPFLLGGGALKTLGHLSNPDFKRVSESWRKTAASI
jgi:tetratricopeptide (TPR) repeat protein